MAYIPRRNYTLAHLDEVQLITGINDWFSFLDRQDRLIYLMQISHPPGTEIGEQEKNPFLSSCDWSVLGLLEWYGLWSDKTAKEDWLFRQIAKRNYEWWEVGGYFNGESEQARTITARFNRLIDLAKRGDL